MRAAGLFTPGSSTCQSSSARMWPKTPWASFSSSRVSKVSAEAEAPKATRVKASRSASLRAEVADQAHGVLAHVLGGRVFQQVEARDDGARRADEVVAHPRGQIGGQFGGLDGGSVAWWALRVMARDLVVI